MPTPTGHKFKACCGFPFVETALGTNDDIRVQLYPNTWGGDPQEIDFGGEMSEDYDRMNIVCTRCGKRAQMVASDLDTPHQLGVDVT